MCSYTASAVGCALQILSLRIYDASYILVSSKDESHVFRGFWVWPHGQKQLEVDAAEIRLRAERPAGELLKDLSKAAEVAALGVLKKQPENWRKLATVPDEITECDETISVPDDPREV